MPINSNIALGVQPIQIADPLAQYSKVAAIQGAQQQNELARMQMAEYERTRGEEEQLRNYLTQSDFSKPEARAGLTKFGKTGLAYSKALTEQDTAKLTQQETAFKVQKAKKDFVAQAQRDTSQNPSDANITAFKEDLMANPLFTDSEKAQMVAGADRILSMPVDQRRAFMASQGASASELKPTFTPQSLGGTVQVLQTPAFGGQATVVPGSTGAVTQTPAQIEQAKRDEKRLNLEGQRVNLEGQRVQLAKAESERKTAGLEALPPKEVQKREAAFPQATSVIKGFETKSDSFVKDLEKLRDHPGLSQITGLVAGRVPALTADGRAAQALYDKVVAKGGFQALQDLRDASKTGGALGNVSNQEGKQLTASFAAIDRRQDAKDVQAAIDDAIGSVQGAKTRMREAYDSTYSYKQPATAAAPAAGANVVVTPDGQTHTFPTPAAAAQFKKAAGL